MDRPPAPLGLEASGQVGLVWLDDDGQLRHLNPTLQSWAGRPASLPQLLPSLDADRWARWRQEGFAGTLGLRMATPDGGTVHVLAQVDRCPLGGWLLTLHADLSAAERQGIDGLQRAVLGHVAAGAPLVQTLDLLCREVEALAPEVLCSVLRVDAEGRLQPLAGPSLPAEYSAALVGIPIGPVVGSCGTAAWRREPVDVRSIATDPLWAPYKNLALQHGLAACWSTPLLLEPDGRVGATFALYYRQESPVAEYHRHLVQACMSLLRVAMLHDESAQRIRQLAYYDAVTSLPNRALFTERAEAQLRVCSESGSEAALLLMDLDRFKAVNDVHGHAVGNAVLRGMAERLSEVVGDSGTLARLGDDEFVVLINGLDREAAQALGERLGQALAAPLPLDRDLQLRLGVSIGFSLYPSDGANLESLLKHADMALNAAKTNGRGSTCGFSATLAHALQDRAWMEVDLRQALAVGGLTLHFQPKLRLGDGAPVGAEVLIRWPHPHHGFIPPDRFIALAEESGLAASLDDWVLETALAQLAQWRREGHAPANLSVNLSPLRVARGDLVDKVKGLLGQHDLPPSCLTLEITERVMLDEREDRFTVDQLGALRAHGVGISIDDFGTGYSCLGYLNRLPISELKIDRAFVAHIAERKADRALVAAVVALAKAFELNLVAEGVETDAQLDTLRELDCAVVQGYPIARPMPATGFMAWLRAQPVA